jgi:hypothetical protein
MLASNRRSARKLNHLFLRCKTQVLSGRRTSSPDDSSIHRCVFCSLFVPGNVLSTSLLSRSNFANCSDWPQASTFCQLTRKDLLQLLIPIQNNIYPIEYRAPFPRPNPHTSFLRGATIEALFKEPSSFQFRKTLSYNSFSRVCFSALALRSVSFRLVNVHFAPSKSRLSGRNFAARLITSRRNCLQTIIQKENHNVCIRRNSSKTGTTGKQHPSLAKLLPVRVRTYRKAPAFPALPECVPCCFLEANSNSNNKNSPPLHKISLPLLHILLAT